MSGVESLSSFQPPTAAQLSQAAEPFNSGPVQSFSTEFQAQQQQIIDPSGTLAPVLQICPALQEKLEAKPLQPAPSKPAANFSPNSKYFKESWDYRHPFDPGAQSYENWRVEATCPYQKK